MISLQLGQVDPGFAVAIQYGRRKSIPTLLWVTLFATADESRCLYDTRHRLLGLWDRIHLVDPTLAATYLEVLLRGIDVNGDRVTVRPGSERIVGAASMYLLCALSDPNPIVVEDMRQRYRGVIPPEANFEGPFRHTMVAIHALSFNRWERRLFKWLDYQPCAQEHALFATTLVQVAYNRRQHGKVPRWVLRFSLHSMLMDPEPPVSVIADCLMIIAIDLGCNISESDISNLDKRYAYLTQLHSLPP